MNVAFFRTVTIPLSLLVFLSSTAMAEDPIHEIPPAASCGNGSIETREQCDDGDAEFGFGEYCDAECNLVPCGNPRDSVDHVPKAGDALFVLKAVVQAVSCDARVCDVNDSHDITAVDALRILKRAVGLAVILNCGTSVLDACKLDDEDCVLQ